MAVRPRVRDDLAVVEIDGEAVIYDQANGALHHLNPTATLVFSLFDGTATMRELAEDVANAYQAPADEIYGHIRSLQRQFRKARLLAEAGKAGPA